MPRKAVLTSRDLDALEHLGGQVRLARLRRKLTQADVAERAGISRLAYANIEQGSASTTIGTLTKVFAVLGYPDRIPGLLDSDPIGDDLDLVEGRQRASSRGNVADF